jgi:hypothetical protein
VTRHAVPDTTPSPIARLWSKWPRWTAWGALLWSATYATAGACWWAGASWYPFAPVPLDRASSSLLESVPARIVGPSFVILGILGVGAATIFLRSNTPAPLRRAATALGVVLAVTATSLIPDYTMLAILALWPILIVFAFTGIAGAQDGIGDILYWHRVNLILIFIGGLLWAGATLAAHRRGRGDCAHCGRTPRSPVTVIQQSREQLLRQGQKFVWTAVLATVPYDITRIAWFLGWPLGLSDEMYETLQDPPELLAVGLGLGILSTAGAALTPRTRGQMGRGVPTLAAANRRQASPGHARRPSRGTGDNHPAPRLRDVRRPRNQRRIRHDELGRLAPQRVLAAVGHRPRRRHLVLLPTTPRSLPPLRHGTCSHRECR